MTQFPQSADRIAPAEPLFDEFALDLVMMNHPGRHSVQAARGHGVGDHRRARAIRRTVAVRGS